MATESLSSARKVIVQLKATADAPILKQNKFKILGTDKFAKVIDFLSRQLQRESMVAYQWYWFLSNLAKELISGFLE